MKKLTTDQIQQFKPEQQEMLAAIQVQRIKNETTFGSERAVTVVRRGCLPSLSPF